MNDNQDKLIREEQKILDHLIDELDEIMLEMDRRLTRNALQAKKAKEKSLPDTYGILISTEHDRKYVKEELKNIRRVRNQLYEDRLVLECTDQYGTEEEELKVGLHSFVVKNRVYVTSWLRPVCRHYIMNNSEDDFDGVVEDSRGRYDAHYKLKLKRRVDLFFDQVEKVTHFFPLLAEEAERILADEFLQELLKRRSDTGFKNIVFSIQKKQGEIIQTPFNNNMIVQGCAGSGKSMIMLHRLPIVLYDNPNSLDRNNLFIITPSLAYIQMANEMRADLEIEDLKMGTIEQYYDHVIKKYDRSPEEYGKKKSYIKLTSDQERYIYSKEMIREIHYQMDQLFAEGYIDISDELRLLGLSKKASSSMSKQHLFREQILSEILAIQDVLNQNDKILWSYHACMRDAINNLEQLGRLLSARKQAVLRGITKLITMYEKDILATKKELSKIDPDKEKVKYVNRLNKIRSVQKNIVDLNETKEIVELDDSYFETLERIGTAISAYLVRFAKFRKNRDEVSVEDYYSAIGKKDELNHVLNTVTIQVEKIGDPYAEWADSMSGFIKKIKPSFDEVDDMNELYLAKESYDRLNESIEYFKGLQETIIPTTYKNVMMKLGQVPDEKGNIEALTCSSYIYLQILNIYQGAPNKAKETLITIDEAQSVAPLEYRLIKEINDDKVILNLFGDVKQHIEGTKGLDDWKEIVDFYKYQIHEMNQNYRNARQITEYCNHRFNTHMEAINLDGFGVHEIKMREEFDKKFIEIFQKPMNPGTSGIVVKNTEEAKEIIKLAGHYKNRIHDMVEGIDDIDINKWNLLTVEQSKGLEFGTVFAITGRMGMNEKYISYTRALNELYVYDLELELSTPEPVTEVTKEEESNEEGSDRKKRKKRKSTEIKEEYKDEPDLSVKDFFASKGMTILDARKTTGFLWIIGEKTDIEPVINEAINIYGISGVYGSGKATQFKNGWYTKTKK